MERSPILCVSVVALAVFTLTPVGTAVADDLKPQQGVEQHGRPTVTQIDPNHGSYAGKRRHTPTNAAVNPDGSNGTPSNAGAGGTGGKPGINDSKNISDGAAKGQASELTVQAPGNGTGGGTGGRPGLNDSKNVSDGAAKGQASELTVQPPQNGTGGSTGGKPGLNDSKNIGDGAAKGQASELTVHAPQNGKGGKSIDWGDGTPQTTR